MTTFSASARSVTPTQLDVKVRDFSFKIDEPASMGGQNTGPNPIEYELASLLGCMTIVMHMIAHEKGIALKSVETEASGELDPRKCAGKPSENRTGLQQIHVDVKIDADCSDEDIQAIVEGAEQRCPVSDNLGHETPLSFTATRA